MQNIYVQVNIIARRGLTSTNRDALMEGAYARELLIKLLYTALIQDQLKPYAMYVYECLDPDQRGRPTAEQMLMKWKGTFNKYDQMSSLIKKKRFSSCKSCLYVYIICTIFVCFFTCFAFMMLLNN